MSSTIPSSQARLALWLTTTARGSIIGLTRGGIRLFWRVPVVEEGAPKPRKAPTRTVELFAAALLLSYGIAMSVFAGPLMQHTDAMATQLLQPQDYVGELRATTPEIRQP